MGHGLHLAEVMARPSTQRAPLFQLFAEMRAQHGPLFRLRLPGLGDVVYLEDVELVREVFRQHGAHVESSFPDSLVRLFGAAVTGPPQQAMRHTFHALVQKTLQEEDRFATMKAMVREEMLSWCGPASGGAAPATGRTLLDDRATRVALRVAVFSFLGETYAFDRGLCDRLITLYADIEAGVFSQFPYAVPGSTMWRALRARRAVDEIVRGVLRDYARRGVSDAYIHEIYDVGVRSYYRADGAETREACGLRSIVGLLFASFDTTRIALMTAMAAMAAHPDFVARLRRELSEAGLRDDVSLTNASLNDLRLLDCFVWEVLRFNPVSQLVPRIAIEDFDLGPYRVEKGWHVWIPVKALCESPAVFKRPERFDPLRFVEDERARLEVVGWIFAAGKRVCPGRRLVMAELKLLCFYLMTLIDLRNDDPRARSGELELRSGIPFSVVRGFEPVFTPRGSVEVERGASTDGSSVEP
ncbi:MAG: cytochrome P450 [Polyangiales bacterium]